MNAARTKSSLPMPLDPRLEELRRAPANFDPALRLSATKALTSPDCVFMAAEQTTLRRQALGTFLPRPDHLRMSRGPTPPTRRCRLSPLSCGRAVHGSRNRLLGA